MLTSSIFTVLASITSTLALPQLITRNTNYTLPTSTSVGYYQGSTSAGMNCFIEVSTGILQAGQCNLISVNAFSISRAPNNNCTFTLFAGTSSCDPSKPELTSSVKTLSFPIDAGNGTQCIETGVQDGGKFQKASGIWACS
ncbi:Hypothetical protein R9X50_00128800 [Acrodontium crateriforme]|uniref:Uncharacterized protein n=1 Tax=Acrodontium crateriforme TaxID=150365 RepID=A0AAQ3R9Y7_9PEZI|nr:Hypothetical protein R9X50_00128800 [Acrodontium crateriforme]